MNSDPLSELWNSSANRPAAAAGSQLAAHFTAKLRRRRRFQAWWLGWTFVALTAVTLLAIVQVVRNGVGALALLPLLGLPWLAAIYFRREFVRARTDAWRTSLPVQAALTAARDSVQAELRKLRVVAMLLVAMLPLSAGAVWHLQATGKAVGNQAWSMAAVFAVALAGGLAGVALRRRSLLAEQRVIAARLAESGSPAGV